MIENILHEAMHDILEGDEINRVLDDCQQRPPCLHAHDISDANPPRFEDLNNYFDPQET